ncbi:MAG: O-antigen ligase family protein [Sphingomonadaceae bacterium]|uniref:O-antigen ligase family protein n=1 Tax=Thermaurantiacus sp. TaxID=2820283 RepID=UPI00298F2072|nr:O-antigen ligase family protein [Thermaurantiacus sp.]MCS6987653.1 O-antigen ligase family protein [Sphingomonadaceae bacterium]MDW8415254.1 O-antigen ligase family protein [Thermaurantiacus sp.]
MSPRERILYPYVRRVENLDHKLLRLSGFAALIVVAMLMGFLIAIFPLELVIVPFLPVLVLLGLVAWMAPDIDPPLDRPIAKLLLFTLGASLFWPHYVAFVLPGVGFITPTRLGLLLVTVLFLFAVATSARVRGTIGAALGAAPVTKWAFILFMVIQALLAVVWFKFSSRWVIAQFFWYNLFLISVFVFSFPHMARTFGIVVLCSIPWWCGLAYWEYIHNYKPWMPHIPDFLRGDPEIWAKIIEGQRRLGSDRYRASGMLLTSVTVGELIGYAYPFVLWANVHLLKGWQRVVGFLLLGCLVLGLLAAGSRTGWGGIVVGSAVFLSLWAYRRWLRSGRKRDIIGPAAIWAYPALFIATVVMVLTWPRARSHIIGGAVHKASDNARAEQWRRTWKALKENPFGYGPFDTNSTVQYYNKAGRGTIDGYYINLLVDYGVVGFLLWWLFFFSAIYLAARTYLMASNRDEEVAGAVAASLVAYFVAKYGLSQTELQHLDFAAAGLAVGLAWRQKQRLRTLGQKIDIAPPRRASPAPARPILARQGAGRAAPLP